MSRRSIRAALIAGLVAGSTAVIPAAEVAVAAPTAPAATSGRTGHVSTGAPVVLASSTTPSPRSKAPLLRPGSRGPAVTALQNRLSRNGYWVGKATGYYGHATAQAVMAVQKVAGLTRDGVAGPATMKALNDGVRPQARSTHGRVLEIDLKRQILMLAVDGKVAFVVNTSTGTTATPTPRGRYAVTRQIDGWRIAELGGLYRPKYFYKGYAVHGVRDGSIPGRAASHGCARVSMAAMDMLWGRSGIRVGDRVWVY